VARSARAPNGLDRYPQIMIRVNQSYPVKSVLLIMLITHNSLTGKNTVGEKKRKKHTEKIQQSISALYLR